MQHSFFKLFSSLFVVFVFLSFWGFVLHGQKLPGHIRKEQSPISTASPLPNNKQVILLIDSAIALSQQDADAALTLLHKAIKAALHHGRDSDAAEAFSHIITIYNNKGKYQEAYAFGQQMLEIALSRKMEVMLTTVYNSFANRFQRTGHYDSSMYYYYKAIATVEQSKTYPNKAALPTLYTNLSGVLILLGDDEKCIAYLNKAEAIAKEIKRWHLLSLILINKGNAFNNLRQHDSSSKNLIEALAIAKKNNYLQWEHLALSNLGSTKYQQGKLKEALYYLQQAIKLKGDIDPNYQNTNISLLGKVYLSLGNYTLAENYLLQSLRTAEQLNIARDLVESHQLLAGLYDKINDHKKAFDHQYLYTVLKDSIEGQETKQNINQLEIKYQTAQKDKELVKKELQISKQKTQIKQRNLWIVGISSGALLLAAIVTLLYTLYRSSWHQKRFQDEKFRNLEQEQEIGQLRAMMKGEEKERIRIAQDLHDGIGGMLASIKMNLNTIGKEQSELRILPNFIKVSGMLNETATEVRKTAHNLMPDALSKQDLRAALLQYCENNSSTTLHIDLQYDVAEQINKDAELFIYRIVQELVQNMVKHAKASYAVIQLMLHNNSLSITVEDNGIGFDTTVPTKGSGLQNMNKRVETLQGYISISSGKGKGTTVHIEFDFNKLKKL
ncbi:MAG: sensor histidine kinase [Taibaiella sp.]|jgi:signal transduction histidine kinase